MQKVRRFRLLRLKYQISCVELAQAADISPQRISQLELDLSYRPQKAAVLLETAFEQIIDRRSREVEQLQADFNHCRGSLMEPVEEGNHEQ